MFKRFFFGKIVSMLSLELTLFYIVLHCVLANGVISAVLGDILITPKVKNNFLLYYLQK